MKEIARLNGPYIHGPSSQSGLVGRAYYNVYYTDGTRSTILRSRYMMEQHLGRKLRRDEHVDHINGDPTDDRLENLQVLSDTEHGAKTSKDLSRSVEWVTVECLRCGDAVQKVARHVRHNKKQGKAGPFCGRSCASKYQHGNKAL